MSALFQFHQEAESQRSPAGESLYRIEFLSRALLESLPSLAADAMHVADIIKDVASLGGNLAGCVAVLKARQKLGLP
jgi:hypothetical protein